MVSTSLTSPIFWPPRRYCAWGESDIDSWPPATITVASPLAICCMPIATVRRPEPQTWLRPQAVAFSGMPAAMAA